MALAPNAIGGYHRLVWKKLENLQVGCIAWNKSFPGSCSRQSLCPIYLSLMESYSAMGSPLEAYSPEEAFLWSSKELKSQ